MVNDKKTTNPSVEKNGRLTPRSPIVLNKRIKDHKTRYQLVGPYLFLDTYLLDNKIVK